MDLSTKSLLKTFCKYVYYAGAGNHWYEPNVYEETITYKLYSFLSFSIYIVMIFLENLAALFGNFPGVEKQTAFMFSIIHNIILVKMGLLIYHRESIKKLNFEVANLGCDFEEGYVMKRQRRKLMLGMVLYAVTVYLSLGSFGVESTRKSVVDGAPFYTVVTFLPKYADATNVAMVFRIFFYCTWLYMMLPMMSADGMPIAHLIVMSYKFVTLRHHFKRIRTNFNAALKIDEKKATEDLIKGCIDGIKMHQTLLLLTNEVSRVFGIVMSLQVCESSAIAVLLLLRLALSPHLDLTNAFMTYTFVSSLFLLLALNLWNAGEVTYQASLLSDSIFNCGWHLCPLATSKLLRRLVLISCAQAQKPLVLKAFGLQDLSYATFVSVARMTYSVFAVFYKRG